MRQDAETLRARNRDVEEAPLLVDLVLLDRAVERVRSVFASRDKHDRPLETFRRVAGRDGHFLQRGQIWVNIGALDFQRLVLYLELCVTLCILRVDVGRQHRGREEDFEWRRLGIGDGLRGRAEGREGQDATRRDAAEVQRQGLRQVEIVLIILLYLVGEEQVVLLLLCCLATPFDLDLVKLRRVGLVGVGSCRQIGNRRVLVRDSRSVGLPKHERSASPAERGESATSAHLQLHDVFPALGRIMRLRTVEVRTVSDAVDYQVDQGSDIGSLPDMRRPPASARTRGGMHTRVPDTAAPRPPSCVHHARPPRAP